MIPITFCNFSKKPNSTARPYVGPTTFTITARQEGEGTPSPSNPRPILPGLSFRLDNNQMDNNYGGSIDLVSGGEVGTHGVVDLGSLYWTSASSQNSIFRAVISDMKSATSAAERLTGGMMCEQLKLASSVVIDGNMDDKAFVRYIDHQIVIRFIGETTSTIGTTLNGVKFVYPLDTPTTATRSQSELSRAAAALGVPWPIHLPSMYQADNCELIEDTSIITPKIRWHEHDLYSPYDFNYCYIPTFERYYFVTNITYQLGTWLIDLSVDVLATARYVIGSSTQYILRSAYEYDGNIVDTMYPTKTNPKKVVVPAEMDQTYLSPKTIFGSIPLPCFVVGLIGPVAASVTPIVDDASKLLYNGSVVYYVLRLPQLRQLIDTILTENNFIPTYGIPTSELSEALQKQLINPMQYIHSIKAMPCTPDNVLVSNQPGFMMGWTPFVLEHQSVLGGWSIIVNKNPGGYAPVPTDGAQGYLQTFRCEVRARLHPAYATRGHYVVGAPFSKYEVYVEPFGTIELTPGNMLASRIDTYTSQDDSYDYIALYFDCTVDYSTGDARLKIWSYAADTGIAHIEVVHYIGTQNVGVDVPFHQATQDAYGYRQSMRNLQEGMAQTPLNILKGLFGVQQGVMSSKPAGYAYAGSQATNVGSGMISSIESGKNAIDSAEAAAQVGIQTGSSSVGSWLTYCKDLCSPVAHCYFYPIVDELNSDLGRPLCSPRQISNVPGYNLCLNGHIVSGLTAQENQMIEDFLNGGFYYE